MTATPVAQPKLLIVDDQSINILRLHQIFAADYQIFIAANGPDALEVCQKNPPDLILLDVIMPEMDGYEVCRQLKKQPATAHIPVIFVSGHTEADEEELGLDAGAIDFIAKSSSARIIKTRVNTYITLQQQTEQLRVISRTDSLTGIANYQYFEEALNNEWRRCARETKALSLIMIDIDYFKHFNDRYGHKAGDTCLQHVASCIRAGFTRSHDLVARYGGEEFVCVLPDTPLEGAESKANLLQLTIRTLTIVHEDAEIDEGIVTVSLGVVSIVPNANSVPNDLITSAQHMLREAKQHGPGGIKSYQL